MGNAGGQGGDDLQTLVVGKGLELLVQLLDGFVFPAQGPNLPVASAHQPQAQNEQQAEPRDNHPAAGQHGQGIRPQGFQQRLMAVMVQDDLFAAVEHKHGGADTGDNEQQGDNQQHPCGDLPRFTLFHGDAPLSSG